MANRKQIAHIWAQQEKKHGKASNLYFDGPTIYSYGPHFPIARFIERNGRRAVLFTTRTYSNTTSAHICAARGALYGLAVPVFHVDDVTAEPRREMSATYKARIAELAESAARARTHGESRMAAAQEVTREANAMAEFFGWRWRLVPPELSPESLAKIREGIAKRTKAQKAKDAARARKIEQENREAIAKWRAGESVSLNRYYAGDTMLRVVTRTELTGGGHMAIPVQIVQTSRGAEVPAAHARRIWPIIQRAVRTGQPYQRNGHTERVGEFAIDAIGTDGELRAGCHTIKYDELARCAAALGCEVQS